MSERKKMEFDSSFPLITPRRPKRLGIPEEWPYPPLTPASERRRVEDIRSILKEIRDRLDAIDKRIERIEKLLSVK